MCSKLQRMEQGLQQVGLVGECRVGRKAPGCLLEAALRLRARIKLFQDTLCVKAACCWWQTCTRSPLCHLLRSPATCALPSCSCMRPQEAQSSPRPPGVTTSTALPGMRSCQQPRQLPLSTFRSRPLTLWLRPSGRVSRIGRVQRRMLSLPVCTTVATLTQLLAWQVGGGVRWVGGGCPGGGGVEWEGRQLQKVVAQGEGFENVWVLLILNSKGHCQTQAIW